MHVTCIFKWNVTQRVCVCVGSATKTEHSRDIRRALVVFHSALFVVVVVVVVAVCICIRVYLWIAWHFECVGVLFNLPSLGSCTATWIHHWLWHLIAILKCCLCSCSYTYVHASIDYAILVCVCCAFFSYFFYSFRSLQTILYNRYHLNDNDEVRHSLVARIRLYFECIRIVWLSATVFDFGSLAANMFDFIKYYTRDNYSIKTQSYTHKHTVAAKFRFHSFRPRKLKNYA